MKTKLAVLLLAAAGSILALPPDPCTKTREHPNASSAPQREPPDPCMVWWLGVLARL